MTTIPSSGQDGPGLLAPHVTTGPEYQCLITSEPSSGEFFCYDDSSFTLFGAASGVYTVNFDVYENGVFQSSESDTITIEASLMAFPSFQDVTTTEGPASTATSWGVDMPATVNVGDLLLFCVHCKATSNNAVTFNTPTGWTKIGGTPNLNTGSAALFAKEADGTEDGTTVTVTQSTTLSCTFSAHCYRFTGAEGVSDIEENNTTTPATNVTPPSLSPAWGSEDTTWLIFVCSTDDDASTTSASTNYTTNLTDPATGQGTNNSARTASSYRDNAAATETPGAWTLSEIESILAFTVAVRPAAAADVTVTVPVGSITLTEFAPTLLTPIAIDVPVGAISLAGLAPNVGNPVTVEVPVGSISLGGLAPSIIAPATISVPTGAISLNGLVPIVGTDNSITVEIPVGSISLSGLAPLVINPGSITIPTGSISLAGLVPTVTVGGVSQTVRCNLVTVNGSSRPNLSLLSWAWFDQVDPSLFVSPTDQGELETTDGTGEIIVELSGTSLTTGQTGSLVLRSDDGLSYGVYNLNID